MNSPPTDKPSPFIYLLNAMDRAMQEANPAQHGYAEKRRAVLEYVAKLEAAAPSAARPSELADEIEREVAEVPDDGAAARKFLSFYSRVIDALRAPVSATSPHYVWAVESKTTFVLFASEDLAKTYVSSFPASIGGGMGIAKLAVLRGKTDRDGANG